MARELPENARYDAIIVLGAQVKPDGRLSVQLAWRMDAAVKAYERHAVPVAVCGARGADEPCTEAEAMRDYLIAHGVPPERILPDPDSFNTEQNLANAKRLLSGLPGIRRVLIVTSDYHLPRSMAIARDLGYEAEGLGSPCKPRYWLKNHAREALAWGKYLIRKYLHIRW